MELAYTQIIAGAHQAVMASEDVLETVRTNAVSTEHVKRVLELATISLQCAEDAIARATGTGNVAITVPMN